jgi:hypothetical protein
VLLLVRLQQAGHFKKLTIQIELVSQLILAIQLENPQQLNSHFSDFLDSFTSLISLQVAM